MREHDVPQFTVDSHRPVKAFDVLGLSFSTELGYTNMLTALDLAGIPLESKDRTLDDPIVLAGGHAAFNPEPIADFIDAAMIGDGEQAVLDMTEIIRQWKAEGRPGGFRFCQAGMITRPVREPSITGIGEMVDKGLKATGFEEVGLLSLSSADHSEIGDIAKGLADRYEDDKIGLSLPSTRVDAFNVDLANELTRNGRRSGLTFAPAGGSERIRKVINKMVSEEDLIRTVSAAYANAWRQGDV